MWRSAVMAWVLLLTCLGQARPCCCWTEMLRALNPAAVSVPVASCCHAESPEPTTPVGVDALKAASSQESCACPELAPASAPERTSATLDASAPALAAMQALHSPSADSALFLDRQSFAWGRTPAPPSGIYLLHAALLI